MPDKYPEVEKLIDTIKRLKLKISRQGDGRIYEGIFHERLVIEAENIHLVIPVHDEFDDFATGSPIVLFHFILTECEVFEEAKDFEEWKIDSEVSHMPEEVIDNLYRELSEVIPKFRALIGQDIRAVSSNDLEFNMGPAKALRAASLDEFPS